jgi:integrase
MKLNITDRWLNSGAAKKAGDHWDKILPGFGVRVRETGFRSYVLVTRFPGDVNPTRRSLGEVGSIQLADAREKARDWLSMVKLGRDPGVEEQRQREAEERKRESSFRAVADDFIAQKVSNERKGKEVEAEIRKYLIKAWNGDPITEITDDQIAAIVKLRAQKSQSQARNLLTIIKRLFAWAIEQRAYGIKLSPAAQLKPVALCGENVVRDHRLSDNELFALWRAAGRLGYPHGHVYRMLMLTGLRLNEVADARWSEFDLPAGVWVIPKERMKGKNSRARAHAVPLTPEMLAVLAQLPRFKTGDYLFSTTYGEKPVWMGSKIKAKVDERMLRTLRAQARMRGDDPSKVKLGAWENHDLRRNVRSGLSRERIEEHVREAVLAHVRGGIQKHYDVHDYLDEKREALTLWAARLRSIVDPPPPNVVSLKRA